MDLKDTVILMNSEDYEERLKAEIMQTQIRYYKLEKFIDDYIKGRLAFTPLCSVSLLKDQQSAMRLYLRALYTRAEIDGVELPSKTEKHKCFKCYSKSTTKCTECDNYFCEEHGCEKDGICDSCFNQLVRELNTFANI
jgi:hypothetical protein